MTKRVPMPNILKGNFIKSYVYNGPKLAMIKNCVLSQGEWTRDASKYFDCLVECVTVIILWTSSFITESCLLSSYTFHITFVKLYWLIDGFNCNLFHYMFYLYSHKQDFDFKPNSQFDFMCFNNACIVYVKQYFISP